MLTFCEKNPYILEIYVYIKVPHNCLKINAQLPFISRSNLLGLDRKEIMSSSEKHRVANLQSASKRIFVDELKFDIRKGLVVASRRC